MRLHAPPSNSASRRAARIALVYAGIAAMWILFSDAALVRLASSPQQFIWLQTFKGWFFVALTALLLFLMVRGQLAAIESSQRASQRSEARLRSVLASMDDLVFVFDAGNRFVACYQPDAENLLIPPEQFLGKRIDEVALPPDVVRGFKEAIETVRAQGRMLTFDYPLELPIGQRWFSANFSRLRDSTEDASGIIAAVRDITQFKQVEEAARSARALADTLLEEIPNIAVQSYDAQRRVIFWNPASEKLYGYTAEEALGQTLESLIIPEPMRETVIQLHQQWIRDGVPIPAGELDLRHRDGSSVPVHSSHAMIHNSRGEPEMYCIDIDLRESRRAQNELRLAAQVFDCSGEAILIIDANRRILASNRAFTLITGYPKEEVLGRTPEFLFPGHDDKDLSRQIAHTLRDADHWQGEVWSRRKSGETFPEWLGVSAVHDTNGDISNYVAIFTDISERKAIEAKLEHLAHHDPLTSLPNRLLLRDRLEQALALAARDGTRVAVMFLDLDHFKVINDTLGHAIGDKLLRAVVSRLSNCVRDTDTISRQGGDEFLIALAGLQDTGAVSAVAQKILQRMKESFEIDGHTLQCSFSIGIALYPDDGNDFDTLLLKADTAMYTAKEAGRNAYRFFTEQMNAHALERLQMQNCLRQAIEHDELRLHYQPQVDLANGRIIGAEALLRWHSAELGEVAPASFIPIAEDSGLIIPIGEWVLREACRQTEEWRQAGLPPLFVAVNMSALQFERDDPVALVGKVLAEAGLPADCLELEITESLLVKDAEEALTTLERLKKLGIHMAIDDFGTGYSSLSYLKRFPIDKLKIDQSFVRDIATDPDDAAIVSMIIELGHFLNLKIVAEGVEDTLQLAFLTQRDCGSAQGYLFGRPMPAEQFAASVGKRSVADQPPLFAGTQRS